MNCLKHFRKASGLSIANMAKLLEVSPSLYTKVEAGERRPSGNFLTKFSTVFPNFNMNLFFNK